MMPRKIFGKVMEFFPKQLNPFKIQVNLIFDLFPRFSIQNLEGIGSWAKMEVCLLGIYLSTCHIWKVLELSKIVICIFETGALELLEKKWIKGKGWTGRPSATVWPTWTAPTLAPLKMAQGPFGQMLTAHAPRTIARRCARPSAPIVSHRPRSHPRALPRDCLIFAPP
jgi:hypothetical protein